MWTARQIWEAGRQALAAKEAASGEAPAVIAAELAGAPALSDSFDASSFEFAAQPYRIHFRNGASGEYDGAALAVAFPFDPAQVASVEPIGE